MRPPAWVREGALPDRRAAWVLVAAMGCGLVVFSLGAAVLVYFVTMGLERALGIG